jgi:hypothetical protein
MKKYTDYFVFCLLILFFASCNKKNDPKPDEKKVTIIVAEYKTDAPIVDALVEYYKFCPSCMPPGGYSLVFSAQTGYGGECEIPESIFINVSYGIVITPPAPPQNPGIDYYYWPTGSPADHSTSRKYFLTITGEEKIHLIRTGQFPKGYYMELKARGEQASFQPIDIARVYAFPADTSFSFYTYRGQTNNITWNIYDSTDAVISSGGPITIDFPRKGIQEIEIKY